MIAGTTHIVLDVPGPSAGCEVTLAPTRSRIHCAAVVEPRGAVVEMPEEFRLRVKWPAGSNGPRVRIKLVYEHEPPRPLAVTWMDGSEETIDGTPASEDWARIYAFRKCLPEPEQKFLFELDRQTSPNLMPEFKELPAEVRAARIEQWTALLPQLELRLQLRKRGMGSSLPAVTPPDVLIAFSRVVHEATGALGAGDDWRKVGAVLERFAAGDLHRVVRVPRGSSEVEIGLVEPDSYFVYFFAEFALAALDEKQCRSHWEMWKGLLPSLVKMQRYFMERFDEPQCITAYGEPLRALDRAARSAIDLCFARRGSRRSAQEALMKENLDLAPCF